MEILAVSPESLSRAAEVLRNGGIVVFPTETVYGLGADAYNSAAIVKVFEAKGRPHFDPLIVHIADKKTLEKTANLSLLNEEARKKLFILIEKFWPGPLSLVLPKSEKIPGIVTAGLSTVAIRFPANEAAQELISLSGGAVAAPSANLFGTLSPTKAEHIRETLSDKVDIILDGGSTRIGVESTVLDITGEQIRILRHGGIPKEEIESLVGAVEDFSFTAAETSESGLVSPGQLKSHYAPRTPLSVFKKEDILRLPFTKDAAWLFFDESSHNIWLDKHGSQALEAVTKVLSACGNLQEATACLFETLHLLDDLNVNKIFAQLAPQEGLGAAINDRLQRASVA